jgi:hypothetical protein
LKTDFVSLGDLCIGDVSVISCIHLAAGSQTPSAD